MRYQVPQFVDVEDKIFGPFTLKQFLMYVTAAMMLVPIYMLSDLSLFITLALPVVGIAVLFAHLKINGQSLFTLITHFVQFATQPRVYTWRRSRTTKPLVIKDQSWYEASVKAYAGVEHHSLSSIARTLETEGNTVQSEDIPDEYDTQQKV